MLANYHTHTFRCGHAVGEDRAYVERAIERGLKVLGFSDHVPMPFPDGHESRFRVRYADLDDYVQSVLSLRAAYRRDIDIRLGFEAEYYPDLFEGMLERLRPYPVDYLLLGQHFNDSGEAVYNPDMADDPRELARYVDMVIRGMEELDIPLEINILGMRTGRCYPCDRFWPLAKEWGCRVVLGCDAHDPEDVAAPEQLKLAMAYAARFGIEPEERIDLARPF